MDFWDVIWFIVVSFAFIAYLMVMFSILTDVFRDADLSGALKAVWVVCLIFLPFVTALVYLIARGRGMAERQMSAAVRHREAQDAYIRSVATPSPPDQIAQAKSLLDSGTITGSEYEALKAKALA
ncbi:SHOCT domain-containing protein [Aeromicrobium massiliense]|uniref:SHOCT domain-containing protein n=1 Tax=Aeromicrobium massiliense TaxID=1464554 RepID=UPI0002D55BC2|nr:SHOCT domain-containing protein [Aeromicrobium massiliense]